MYKNRRTQGVLQRSWARDHLVNFVYHENPGNTIPYHLYVGLKDALERNGLLYYSFNLSNQKTIDMGKLKKYPVLFIKGYAKMYEMLVFALYGRQKLAMIETETILNNDGKKNVCYDRMEKMSQYFDVVFNDYYKDGGYFGKKTKSFKGFVPMGLYDSINIHPVYDVGFVGNANSESRKEFVKNTPFIMHTNNQEMNTPLDHARAYVLEMKKYKFLVSPTGSTSITNINQRALEYMGCNRLCFEYFNSDFPEKPFKNHEEIVYWSDYDELKELIDYYLLNIDKAQRIAHRGYNRVKKDFSDDVVVKNIVEGIYDI